MDAMECLDIEAAKAEMGKALMRPNSSGCRPTKGFGSILAIVRGADPAELSEPLGDGHERFQVCRWAAFDRKRAAEFRMRRGFPTFWYFGVGHRPAVTGGRFEYGEVVKAAGLHFRC